jgi:hypothetical protein
VLEVCTVGIMLALLLVPHFYVPGICNYVLVAPLQGSSGAFGSPLWSQSYLSASWLVILGEARYGSTPLIRTSSIVVFFSTLIDIWTYKLFSMSALACYR